MQISEVKQGHIYRANIMGGLYFVGAVKVNKRSVKVVIGRNSGTHRSSHLTGQVVSLPAGTLSHVHEGLSVPHDCPLKVGDTVIFPDHSPGWLFTVHDIEQPDFVGVRPVGEGMYGSRYAQPGNLRIRGRASLEDLKKDLGVPGV